MPKLKPAIVLDDDERDGFVQSWYEEQNRPERGGARRRLYMATGKRRPDKEKSEVKDNSKLFMQGGAA